MVPREREATGRAAGRAAAYPTMVVKIAYAPLAGAAVMHLALLVVVRVIVRPAHSPLRVWPPHEASDAERAAVRSNVADALDRPSCFYQLGYLVGQREAVLGRTLDGARVAAQKARQGDERDDGLRVDKAQKHPGLRLVHHRQRCCLRQPYKHRDQREHERCAAARLSALLAALRRWHWRQRINTGPVLSRPTVLEDEEPMLRDLGVATPALHGRAREDPYCKDP